MDVLTEVPDVERETWAALSIEQMDGCRPFGGFWSQAVRAVLCQPKTELRNGVVQVGPGRGQHTVRRLGARLSCLSPEVILQAPRV